MADVVQVDSSKVQIALGQFALSLGQDEQLMQQIGAGMLVSVRRTFREQGSPANSWMPLAPSTIRRDPKKYGRGHKLLIDSGRLLNSITYRTQRGGVVIGTNVKYAAVHQFGSKDRGAIGFGPRTQEQHNATVKVKAHEFDRSMPSLGTGKMKVADKLGRARVVRKAIAGPRGRVHVSMSGRRRHQNIPARPYLVFRPEDPDRIASQVNAFVDKLRRAAGLEGAQ